MVFYIFSLLQLEEYSVKQKNRESTKCKFLKLNYFSWLRDYLLKHEKLSSFLKIETIHVVDFFMEYDQGIDNPYFPEYRTRLSSKNLADL